jgi:hypothetical protein
VEGTVFVDGPFVVNKTIQYHGNGRIVCNGDISLHYKFRPYSNSGHLSATDCIGLVTPGNIMLEVSDNSGQPMPGDPPSWAGAFYCMRQLSIPAQGTLMEGTIIAGQMVASDPNSHLYTNPMLPGYLPDGMPGAGRALVSRGTWTRD